MAAPASPPTCAAAYGALSAALSLAGHLGCLITRGWSKSCRGDTPWPRSIVDLWTRTTAWSTGNFSTTSPFQRINARHVVPRQRLHSRQPQLCSLTLCFSFFTSQSFQHQESLHMSPCFYALAPDSFRFLRQRPFSFLFAYKPLCLYMKLCF
jgi:hypothetical protein